MTEVGTANLDSVILYDTSTHTKWTNEINLSKHQDVYTKYQKNQKNNYNYALKFGVWLKNQFTKRNTETSLKFLSTSSKPWNQWKLAVSRYDDLIAVLQENYIEVYHEFTNLLWRVEITTEFVKICNIFFNHQNDLLVYTNHTGNIYFFDANDGNEVLKYIETSSLEYENAICQMFFIKHENFNLGKEVLEILFTVTYSGYFNVFTINANKTVTKIFSQSLLHIIPSGVYCAEIDADLKYLLIGSFASSTKTNSNPSGLFMWRVLNAEPWIKHCPFNSQEANNNKLDKTSSTSSKLNFSKIEYVTKLEIGPDGNSVAAVYISGKIAVYALPSLNLLNEWFMTEQPGYDEVNSDMVENPYELKMFKQIYSESDFRIVDIGWWSENVLIMTRGTGLLSLVAKDDLSSLMGRNQQFLSPFASLYAHSTNGFIILDCACTLVSQSDLSDLESQHSGESGDPADNEEDEEDEDEEEDSWLYYIKAALRTQAYNLSGLERFKLRTKSPKFLQRRFSLIHFKATTPGELFERKLDAEMYGEALQLAKSYALDTDLVYQKQWRAKPIKKSTIVDYLSKIKKRSWILHECLTRVSADIDTTKYLIDFGLRGTDVDSLIAIANEDDNKFVISQKINLLEEEEEDEFADIFNKEHMERKRARIEAILAEKLKRLGEPSHLTSGQKQLLLVRFKLLKFMDRLNLYEQILGGSLQAADLFCPDRFQSMRHKPILELCIDCAREGDVPAVEVILTYHSRELKQHQLHILANFPETLSPDEYAKLLPKLDEENQVVLFDEEDQIRGDCDWTESAQFQDIIHSLDEKVQAVEAVGEVLLSKEAVESWYLERAVEMERLSGLVDVALRFAELGVVNGCRNLAGTVESLRTLCTLTYECQRERQKQRQGQVTYYTLEYVSGLDELERLSLIMSHAHEPGAELYGQSLREWLVPFVARRPTVSQREKLLKAYFLKVSKEDLMPCYKFFHLQQNGGASLLADINLTSMLIECLYANEQVNQLELCNKLVNELVASTSTTTSTTTPTKLTTGESKKTLITAAQSEQIQLVLSRLKACALFNRYGCQKPLAYVRDSCQSETQCRDALVKLTWFASKRSNALHVNEWIQLMKDLQFLQSSLYRELVSYQDCSEIFLASLLGSRNTDNIKLAYTWLLDIFMCDKEGAVGLAIKAAQEYFNASSNYFDPDMEFAKECLDLVRAMILESEAMTQATADTAHGQNNTKTKDDRAVLAKLSQLDPTVRRCLQQVETESDLIAATRLIAEFELNVLPVQVRSSPNRLIIVKDILRLNAHAYQDWEKLLRLAVLMRLGKQKPTNATEKNDSQPEVLLLIAEHALQMDNFSVVANMSKRLVDLNYAPAWACVYRLAFSLARGVCQQLKLDLSDETDMSKSPNSIAISVTESRIFKKLALHEFSANTKADEGFFSSKANKSKLDQKLAEIESLLAFALTHCDSVHIEEILAQRLLTEQCRQRLNRSSLSANPEPITKDQQQQLSFDKVYLDYFDGSGLADFDVAGMKGYNDAASFYIRQLLTLQKSHDTDGDTNGMLARCLGKLLALDYNLALGFMLEMSDKKVLALGSLFKYESDLSYEFVLYLFALNVLNEYLSKSERSPRTNPSSKWPIYYLSPQSLNKLLDRIDPNESDLSPDLAHLHKSSKGRNSLRMYRKVSTAYTGHRQSRALQELNAGIDLGRFEADAAYKEDTILGLSMAVETFELACSLAKFYAFDVWHVYMAFSEHLLTECDTDTGAGYSLDEIRAKLAPFVDTLRARGQPFLDTMQINILPMIAGTDLDKLSLYFNLLGTEEAATHAKILTKLKGVSLPNLDYKRLLDHPLEIISDYLTDANLQFFSKLLPKLPTKSTKLGPSKIHVIWSLKTFWSLLEEDEPDAEWSPERIQGFTDRCETLNESLKRLDLEADFGEFVRETLASEKSCTRLCVAVRRNLLKKYMRFVKTESKDRSEAIYAMLVKIKGQLRLAEAVYKRFEVEPDLDVVYARRLDWNLAEYLLDAEDTAHFGQLQDTLTGMLYDGFSLRFLAGVLVALELESGGLEMSGLIKRALVTLCGLLKSEDSHKKYVGNQQQASGEKTTCTMDRLKVLLDNISAHLNDESDEKRSRPVEKGKANGKKNKGVEAREEQRGDGGSQVCHEDVMECMRVFWNDQSVGISIRLLVLEELKKSFKDMGEEDLILLLVYKTNAILSDCKQFNNQVDQVTSDDIRTEPQRLKLLERLLGLSTSAEEHLALINMLTIWPTFGNKTTDLENPASKPSNRLLVRMIERNLSFVDGARMLISHEALTDGDIESIRAELESDETKWNESRGQRKLAYLKLCLACRAEKILKHFLRFIQFDCFTSDLDFDNLDQYADDASLQEILGDRELMELLLQDRLYLAVVMTPLYPLFASYLLNAESKNVIYEVVRRLRESGYGLEAAKLFADTEGFCGSYRTLSSCVELLQKFED